jgi:hypothetical protein
LNIPLPEVDIDQYKILLGISVEEYAMRKANEFRSSFFSNSASGSQSQPSNNAGENRNVSSDEYSGSGDNEPK